MKTFTISILFIIFLSNFVSAITIGISPSQIDFNGKIGEEICNLITVSTTGKNIIIGEDRWARKYYTERDLQEHKIGSQSLGISINYPKEIEINNEEKIEVCINVKDSGNYHGVLLYRTKESPAGVGVWMNVTITEGKSEQSIISLTGAIIGTGENRNKNTLFAFSIFLTLVLLVVLIVLKRNKSKGLV